MIPAASHMTLCQEKGLLVRIGDVFKAIHSVIYSTVIALLVRSRFCLFGGRGEQFYNPAGQVRSSSILKEHQGPFSVKREGRLRSGFSFSLCMRSSGLMVAFLFSERFTTAFS